MKIYHTIPDNKNLFKNPIVTIGNFDGVHIGHKKIFTRLMEVARKTSGDAVAITFSHHPRKILNPESHIKILTTSDEKVNAIFNLGIDNIILLNFTLEMANMSAHDFYNDILIKMIDIKELVIGYDHAFGKNREGNIEYLSKLCSETGIGLTRIDEELVEDRPVSSTWIRNEIEKGNLDIAEKLLGRKYSISGLVVKGMGRGKKLGFPTANIIPDDGDKVLPSDGVYSVKVLINSATSRPGMLNIGYNPTFSDTDKTIEVHIFDYNENLYDSIITVEFNQKIREEKKFNSPEELIIQLENDKNKALEQLKDYEKINAI